MKSRFLFQTTCILACFLMFAGCNENTEEAVEKSISVDRTSLVMLEGDDIRIMATSTPAGQTLVWESGDAAVAPVGTNGVVHAIGAGQTVIRVSLQDDSSVSAQIPVTVNSKLISVDRESLAMFVRGKTQLTASPANEAFLWKSDDSGVVTVNTEGLVTATGTGETWITVSLKYDTKVSVRIPVVVDEMIVDRTSLTMLVGYERQLMVSPASETFIWECEDDNVVTVSETGFVSAVGDGNTIIKVTLASDHNVWIDISVAVYEAVFNRTLKLSTVFGNGLLINWDDLDGDFVKFTYPGATGEITKTIDDKEPSVSLLDYYPFPTIGNFSYSTGYLLGDEIFWLDPVVVTAGDINFQKLHILKSSQTLSEPLYIWARDYDLGGEGVGFHNATRASWQFNPGEVYDGCFAYRNSLGDMTNGLVAVTNKDQNGEIIENFVRGSGREDWYRYTVYVENAGSYAIDVHIGCGGTYYGWFIIDGYDDLTSQFSMPPDGSWSAWVIRYHTAPKLELTQGVHTIALKFRASSSTNGANFWGLRLYWSPN